jgi:D-glycero-D-manno-heptose 1,7-bisphosphate phosphatase
MSNLNLNSNKKVIFFDRDDTLIVDKVYLNDPEKIEYLPQVFEALLRLQSAGYEFVIVTNQSGVARGLVTIENINEIHRRMSEVFLKHGVKILAYYFAPYSVESNHPLRKPNPGMLLEAKKEHGVNFSASWMVGDRMTDVEAGHRAGTKTILLTGKVSPEQFEFAPPTACADNLMNVADIILKA